MAKSNIEQLGDTLNKRMKNVSDDTNTVSAELGTITSTSALEPDNSPGPIPAGEYSVCRSISGEIMQKKANEYMADIKYPKLKAGDRVLICWCGNEPVIVDVIL